MWDLIVSVPDHCLSFYFKARHDYSIHFELSQSLGGAKRGDL